MSEEEQLKEDTLKALFIGIRESGWAFDLRRLLTKIFQMEFCEYQRIEAEIKKNWKYITDVIKDVVKSSGVFDLTECDFIWVFPKGLDDEVIRLITGLSLDADVKARVAGIITEGFSLLRALDNFFIPINAFALFLKLLGERLGLVDAKNIEASVSYRGWTAVFRKKYVMHMPPGEGYSEYYIILEGTLENKRLKASVPIYYEGYNFTDDEKSMASAFEWLSLKKLVGFMDAAIRDEFLGRLVFHMLSKNAFSLDMNKKLLMVELEVPKEDFDNLKYCLMFALYKLFQTVHPCYVGPVVFTYPAETFILTSEVYPSPTRDPASRVLMYLAMYSVRGGVIKEELAKLFMESLFEKILGVGEPGAFGLASLLLPIKAKQHHS